MRTLLRHLVYCGSFAAAAATAVPPVAPVRPVTDDYFGTKVIDPYRWMEDRHAPEFLASATM